MKHLLAIAILLGILTHLPAHADDAPKVTAVVKKITYDIESSALGAGTRGSAVAGTGYYPLRDPATKQPRFEISPITVDVIVLDNGIVEAWVAPSLGGRLLRAFDKKTGVDYFWQRTRDGKPLLDNKLPWTPGGVKASFPFFEHGLHLQVPAGCRIVNTPDGGVTVAMDMRFTNYNTVADIARYGAYGDEALTVLVSLAPGSSVVTWTQRKDNNNATPRSDRMWNCTAFPSEVVTKEITQTDKQGKATTRTVADTDAIDKLMHFVYPARWVVDHGPTTVHTSPHPSALTNWNVSHFAIDAPWGFTGGYYRANDLNRLRINDTRPGHGPGAKLWAAAGRDMFEIWGGESWVFEYPGELLPAHKPSSFTHQFWIAQGIGPVSYANALVAVGIDAAAFRLVASRNAVATVIDETGNTVASGPVGPYTVLSGKFGGKRLIVTVDGKPAMDQTFPLDRPTPGTPPPAEIKAAFDRLKAGVQPGHATFYERGAYARNEGQPALVNAWETFAKVTDAANRERVASLARVAYRLGNPDEAARLAKLAGGPEGDFVLALLALDAGKPADFGAAGPEADYLRALAAKKAGDTKAAVELARTYVKSVPDAWYPRLAIACWTRDAAMADALAAENPASPEAQWVLKHLGRPHELDATIANREVARQHLAIFEAQIERGEYRPLPRYPVELLKSKGW